MCCVEEEGTPLEKEKLKVDGVGGVRAPPEKEKSKLSGEKQGAKNRK